MCTVLLPPGVNTIAEFQFWYITNYNSRRPTWPIYQFDVWWSPVRTEWKVFQLITLLTVLILSLDDQMNGRRLWIRVQWHRSTDTPLAQLKVTLSQNLEQDTIVYVTFNIVARSCNRLGECCALSGWGLYMTSWSPVHRSPTDCGASLCVI
jgi:hypothetical protein